MANERKPPKRPSADEAALFRAAMTAARPLPGREDATPPQPAAPEHRERTSRPPPPARSAPPARPVLEAGAPAGLDRRTMDRLRKGRMRPEARLDLHGMTAADAHRALTGFLADSRAAGRRCLLVITGKGSLLKGGGVLRRELPAWLNAPGVRPDVLGYCEARPQDGGSGAVYILLRRRR